MKRAVRAMLFAAVLLGIAMGSGVSVAEEKTDLQSAVPETTPENAVDSGLCVVTLDDTLMMYLPNTWSQMADDGNQSMIWYEGAGESFQAVTMKRVKNAMGDSNAAAQRMAQQVGCSVEEQTINGMQTWLVRFEQMGSPYYAWYIADADAAYYNLVMAVGETAKQYVEETLSPCGDGA